MAPAIMHAKNTTALRKMGWWRMPNFGNGFCGDLSVLAQCLVEGGFHPKELQDALMAHNYRARVMDILKHDGERLVDRVSTDGFTDGTVKGDADNLPTKNAWIDVIENDRELDFRGIFTLLAKQFGIDMQILQQMVDGDA